MLAKNDAILYEYRTAQACRRGAPGVEVILCLLLCISSITSSPVAEKHKIKQQPPTPIWPNVFTINFDVLVESYGKDWKSSGLLYYHWTNETFREDYIDWCLPLFGEPEEFNNYTCSFLATNGNMYFVNHTSPGKVWSENDCCLFAPGLGATAPDWMKNDQYNGTGNIRGIDVDVWWFPGTNDPNKPCYGYWNIRDKMNTPVRFFGLSSLGPTILDYSKFRPGMLDDSVAISMPNSGCSQECKPPVAAGETPIMKDDKTASRNVAAPWPDWPSCQ